MVRGKVVSKKTREEPRLDSGTALSDPVALSSGSVKGTLTLPIFRNTNWNYGAPKARYRNTELKLRQPRGFPIKPLKITLDRARDEAELEASAQQYADPGFKIYEDLKEDDELEKGDDYDDKVEPENKEAQDIADDLEYGSADGSADDSDASAELPISKATIKQPAALIDSRGRTRAATVRRKAQEVYGFTMPLVVSCEDKLNTTTNSKKRKHGNTQAAKQPRKTLPRKSA